MPSQPPDARSAFLNNADLFDFMGKLARKIVRDEHQAKDVRNGAYEVALHLVVAGKGPSDDPKHRRAWMCTVLKRHASEEWRKQRSVEPVDVEVDGLPAEDARELAVAQEEAERVRDLQLELIRKHKALAELFKEVDGRSEGGAAKDAAARQRKARAKATFAAMLASATVAAVVAWLVMRNAVPLPNPHPAVALTDLATAGALRERALRSCATGAWEPCLSELDVARRLDPPGHAAPPVQTAWRGAIGSLRAAGIEQCHKEFWARCAASLDLASRFDPDGDKDPLVALARSEAGPARRGDGDRAPVNNAKGP